MEAPGEGSLFLGLLGPCAGHAVACTVGSLGPYAGHAVACTVGILGPVLVMLWPTPWVFFQGVCWSPVACIIAPFVVSPRGCFVFEVELLCRALCWAPC